MSKLDVDYTDLLRRMVSREEIENVDKAPGPDDLMVCSTKNIGM